MDRKVVMKNYQIAIHLHIELVNTGKFTSLLEIVWINCDNVSVGQCAHCPLSDVVRGKNIDLNENYIFNSRENTRFFFYKHLPKNPGSRPSSKVSSGTLATIEF